MKLKEQEEKNEAKKGEKERRDRHTERGRQTRVISVI